MNIGVCVPLNPAPKHPSHSGPIRYVTDEAGDRAEQALRDRQSEQAREDDDSH